MPASRKRQLVGILLLSCFAVLGLLVVQWRALAIRHCVARLESEDQYSVFDPDIVLASPLGVSGRALDEYVKTPDGQGRLLLTYLFLARIHEQLVDLDRKGQSAGVFLWMTDGKICVTQVLDKDQVTLDSIATDKPIPHSAPPIDPVRATLRIQDLLRDAALDRRPVPHIPVLTGVFPTQLPPNLVMSMVGCDISDEDCRRNFGPILRCRAPYAFLVESEDSELIATGGGSVGLRVTVR